MQLEAKKCLEDVRQAAELILQFTAGKSFDDYDADVLLRSAVVRRIETNTNPHLSSLINRISADSID
jgi:uncharacterized protein with HEPN domain